MFRRRKRAHHLQRRAFICRFHRQLAKPGAPPGRVSRPWTPPRARRCPPLRCALSYAAQTPLQPCAAWLRSLALKRQAPTSPRWPPSACRAWRCRTSCRCRRGAWRATCCATALSQARSSVLQTLASSLALPCAHRAHAPARADAEWEALAVAAVAVIVSEARPVAPAAHTASPHFSDDSFSLIKNRRSPQSTASRFSVWRPASLPALRLLRCARLPAWTPLWALVTPRSVPPQPQRWARTWRADATWRRRCVAWSPPRAMRRRMRPPPPSALSQPCSERRRASARARLAQQRRTQPPAAPPPTRRRKPGARDASSWHAPPSSRPHFAHPPSTPWCAPLAFALIRLRVTNIPVASPVLCYSRCVWWRAGCAARRGRAASSSAAFRRRRRRRAGRPRGDAADVYGGAGAAPGTGSGGSPGAAPPGHPAGTILLLLRDA
jgi:hypothetical protein